MNLIKKNKGESIRNNRKQKGEFEKNILINCMKMTGIKISIVTILALGFSTAFFFNSVYALAGSGTAKDPYIVSIEDELRECIAYKIYKVMGLRGCKKINNNNKEHSNW